MTDAQARAAAHEIVYMIHAEGIDMSIKEAKSVTAEIIQRYCGEPDVRRGWRAFECELCSLIFAMPTRDHASPSQDDCPHCRAVGDGTQCRPIRSWPDAELVVDEHGNLIGGGL